MRSRILFVTALLVFACSGCRSQGELRGSVFIVSKGGENYKLGLVKVSAIPEEKMRQFVEDKKAYVRGEVNRLKASQDSFRQELDAAQRNYDEAKKAFDALSVEKEALTSKEQELAAGLAPPAGEDAPYYEDEADPQEEARQRKVQQQLQAVRRQKAKQAPVLEEARVRLGEAEKHLSGLKTQALANQLKLREALDNGLLFEGVPEGSVKAVTDADGKFVLALPASGKFAIAAQAERRVFDTTERYYWLVWTSLDGQDSRQLMLSNQNMLGQDSDDSVFKLKELLPEDAGPGKTSL